MVHFRYIAPTFEPEAVEGHFPQRFLDGLSATPLPVPRLRRLRVAVVDDDRDTADSLSTVLTLLGHETHAAYSGVAGLELVRTCEPDVVICDLAMPGMDGYSLVQTLRGGIASAQTTYIAASGYGAECDQARARDAGFHLHLLKPLDLDRLRDILAECARRRSLRDR